MIVDSPAGHGHGYTYFAICIGKPLVKIGQASVLYRAYDVKPTFGDQSLLLLAMKGCSFERKFHAFLEPLHDSNEWFRLERRITSVIRDLQSNTFDFSKLPNNGWCITKAYQTKASVAHWGPLAQYRIAA